jgi:hypothetical protein
MLWGLSNRPQTPSDINLIKSAKNALPETRHLFLRERRQIMVQPFSKVTVVTITFGQKKPVIILI